MSVGSLPFSLLLITLVFLFTVRVESVPPTNTIPDAPASENTKIIDVESIAPWGKIDFTAGLPMAYAPTSEIIDNEFIETDPLNLPYSETIDLETIDVESIAPTGETEPMIEKRIYFVTYSPPNAEDPEAFSTKILTKVIGSEEAATSALLYEDTDIKLFAANLTEDEATRLTRIPGITYMIKAEELA